MPGMDGIETIRGLRAAGLPGEVLVLTASLDDHLVKGALQAGARGYLLKRSAAEDLVRAVRAVADGGVYLDPAIADKALPSAAPAFGAGVEAELSPREADVLRLTARGFSNKEIGARLDVSVKTVETYKARGAEKLGLRSRAEIVRHGAAQGWLDDLADGT
jgi:DNA-binding NarL/FixJ family response regulator